MACWTDHLEHSDHCYTQKYEHYMPLLMRDVRSIIHTYIYIYMNANPTCVLLS